MPVKILYEDNHIIAVYKPAGVLVQQDASGEESLMDQVKSYIKEEYKKPGNVFLGMVHRLDRNVSGIVLFGKTSKGAARLSEQFRNGEIKKTYIAIVEGEPGPSKGSLINYLKKDEQKRIALISGSPKSGYDRAELEYENIKSKNKFTLVNINLKTGKFHQIRAQLSHAGFPIVGDKKYGSKTPEDFLALCAVKVEFKTITGEPKKIEIKSPKEWSKYF